MKKKRNLTPERFPLRRESMVSSIQYLTAICGFHRNFSIFTPKRLQNVRLRIGSDYGAGGGGYTRGIG